MADTPSTLYVVADGKQVRMLVRAEDGLKPYRAFDAQGHGDSGHDADTAVRHIHSPKVDPHGQAKEHFARHVAKHLNEAVAGGVKHFHLAAGGNVLHDIVAALSKGAEAAMLSKQHKELIHLSDRELLSHFPH